MDPQQNQHSSDPQPEPQPQPTPQPTPPPYQPPAPMAPPQPDPQPTQPAQFTPSPTPMAPPAYTPPTTHGSYAPSRPAGLNKTLIAIVAAAVLIIAAVAVWFFFFKNGSPLSGIFGGADVVDRSGTTLDLSSLIDRQATIKTQSISAKRNQQINLSDGTSYMVTSVQRNFVAAKGSFVKADAGKELIKINVVVGNRDKSTSSYVSDSMFKLKNSAGGLQSPEFIDTDDTPDALPSGDVAAGKQTQGAIVFQVDSGEKGLSLVLDNDYESLGNSSKKATIHSEVSLD